jgi:hypothetical protein
MIIRRKVNSRFTVVPNEPINDEALTFEALGLLSYLLSRPDNWQVKLSQLRIRGGLGRDKAQKLMRQLIDAGYVVRRQDRSQTSKQFKDWEYIVYDCPQLQKDDAEPEPENPVAAQESQGVAFEPQPEKPEPENQAAIINTDCTKSPYGEASASRKDEVLKKGDTISPLPKPPSLSSQIWAEALCLLSQCQLSEPQRRKVIGKWQKRTSTELAKKELLAAVRGAAKSGTPDPISYVEAALRDYPVPPDPRTFTATDWQRKVQAAIKTQQWARDWGPPPGKRGCHVPPELITQQLQSALGQGMRQ